MKKCPLCEESPQKGISSRRGYDFYYCSCGAAGSGEIASVAAKKWNALVEERKTKLLIAIVKKLGITVTDEESAETYDILTGKLDQRSL